MAYRILQGNVQVGFAHTTATLGALLERADELSALNDRLDTVEASGRGHVVLLGGEAGVGKTALIRELCAARAGDEGVTWLHSYVSDDGTRTYCVYEGPSPEAIRKAAAANKLPLDRITQVRVLDPYYFLA